MKLSSLLAASVAALALVAAQAEAQQAPQVTYSTDTFDHWHLTADGWKLPPEQPPEQAKGTHAYVYSLALQAAIWGLPLTTFYSLRDHPNLASGGPSWDQTTC